MGEPSRVVLASSSPRRRDLLGQWGVPFAVVSPDVDETVRTGETATEYVARVAADKAEAGCAEPSDDTVVIAADTTVELDGEILGKPADLDEARVMLARLSGRTHQVHTGVVVRRGDRAAVGVETTAVTFAELSAATIGWYVEHDSVLDKAGSYGMQSAGGVLVARVEGCVSNVVGLPLPLLGRLAREVGWNPLR